MKKICDYICKFRWIIILLCVFLTIPAALGYAATGIKYDVLSYLPSDIETLKGQNILAEDFNMGAFAVAVVDQKLPSHEILDLESEIKKVDGVEQIVSLADVTGSTIPLDFLPTDIRESFMSGDKQLMIITFSDMTSADRTVNAVAEIRKIVGDKCLIGGMTAMMLDTRTLFRSEMTLYIIIATLLCLVVLMISLDSYIVPLLLLLNIGAAVVYNMGSNIIFGEISYITRAISSVLQLGVTMDFSIFLYHKYEEKKRSERNHQKAMSLAIAETATSIIGSSLTTFAGFLALCTMDLTLGTDIGLVMAKGVLIGLAAAVTLFPSLILAFDKLIEKSHHKQILPKFTHIKNLVIKYNKIILIVFALAFVPAYICQAKTDIYYNLDGSIPAEYGYTRATKSLKEDFGMASQMIVLAKKDMAPAQFNQMVADFESYDGVDAVLSSSMLYQYGFTADLLPSNLRAVFESENYSAVLVMSSYGSATNELNDLINKITDSAKDYNPDNIVAGEGPLMKDLVEVSNHDFKIVNFVSAGVILLIMALVLRSLSLPFLLVAAIEFAIFVNMGVPYLTGTSIPFVASIVIGTIQLGATIDYAILITTKYIEARKKGIAKNEAASLSLGGSIQSIFVSAMCFFAATIGVALVSEIDMIASLCLLIARGAVISMFVVNLVIPALLIFFDSIICKTTLGFRKETK